MTPLESHSNVIVLLIFIKTFWNNNDSIRMDLGKEEMQKSPPTLKETMDSLGQTEHPYEVSAKIIQHNSW